MMDEVILAVDQGTSNTKALLVDRSGAVRARASEALARTHPCPGWVEQDPMAILQSVGNAVDGALSQRRGARVTAIGISNQRESVLLWERDSGVPVGPCVSWQCRRSEPFCAELRSRGAEPAVQARTGLPIDPLFSASKARWLLSRIDDGRERAEQGELCLGTVDSWLLWYLSGGGVHACDMSNAARTQLFNIYETRWDAELLDLFGIPAQALPRVLPSGGPFGTSVARSSLPTGIPIASMLGDSHASLFGQGGFRPGLVKATYGTGTSLMSPVPAPVAARQGLTTTIAWARPDPTYALEGNIASTGAAVAWLGRLLNLEDPVRGVAALAMRVPDSGGAYLVPAFAGLGSPYWDAGARGLMCGLTEATTAAHLARAVLDAIAFQVRDVFDVMRANSPFAFHTLLADGGASRNDMLMQIQADTLDLPVMRTSSADVSALGAAYLAGLTVGFWASEEEVASLIGHRDRFEPGPGAARREEHYAGWREAVARTRLKNASQVERS